ncbi:MAG: DUF4184 family protein [Ilumatobacter sp.]|nr:DUF4184 family protein [Ilumatobacter sp.]
MPVTWFAHQAPAVGLKLARPRWFDGTALCVGSIVPDTMISVTDDLGIDSHTLPSAVVIGLPLGLALTWALRFVVAPMAPTVLPDVGPFRVHSYGVLAHRRPAARMTVVSVLIGIATHIVMDWFTHNGRWVPSALGYDDAEVTWFGTTRTGPEALQIVGHITMSATTLALLWVLGRRRRLDEWYGPSAVERARTARLGAGAAVRFWLAIAVGAAIGSLWTAAFWVVAVERVALVVYVGSIVGAIWARRAAGRPVTGSLGEERVPVRVGAVEAAEEIRPDDDRFVP